MSSEHTVDIYHRFEPINLLNDDTLSLTFQIHMGPMSAQWRYTWTAPYAISVVGAALTLMRYEGQDESWLALYTDDNDFIEIENPVGEWIVDGTDKQEARQEIQAQDLSGRRGDGGVVRERNSHLLDQPWTGLNDLSAR